MRKTNKKNRKNNFLPVCTDCDKKTNDFYKIPTNKGDIVKCAPCYELWYSRKNRTIIDYVNSKTTEEF
jgi:hypothetical protein